tara:strand:- start:4272 stop:4835 length:564 start_codon:yes stop_codon:yes gene_type:complete
MDIATQNIDGFVSYSANDMERLLKQERSIFMLDDYVFRSCPKTIYRKDGFIFEDSVIDLMNYLHKEEGIIMCLSIKEYIKSKKPKKRAYSTSHRIEVAYKTRWRCAHCRVLLEPDFQIDHIKELRYGGEDAWENLCALCVPCHSKKTRANTLKMNETFKKEFGQRAQVIEDTIFENLKYKPKTSKYF